MDVTNTFFRAAQTVKSLNFFKETKPIKPDYFNIFAKYLGTGDGVYKSVNLLRTIIGWSQYLSNKYLEVFSGAWFDALRKSGKFLAHTSDVTVLPKISFTLQEWREAFQKYEQGKAKRISLQEKTELREKVVKNGADVIGDFAKAALLLNTTKVISIGAMAICSISYVGILSSMLNDSINFKHAVEHINRSWQKENTYKLNAKQNIDEIELRRKEMINIVKRISGLAIGILFIGELLLGSMMVALPTLLTLFTVNILSSFALHIYNKSRAVVLREKVYA